MIYTADELKEKIKALDQKIEEATSQVSFGGRTVSYQVSAWEKQRERYQQLLDEALAKQKPKKHRIRYATLHTRF